ASAWSTLSLWGVTAPPVHFHWLTSFVSFEPPVVNPRSDVPVGSLMMPVENSGEPCASQSAAPFDTALPSSSKPLTSGLAEAANGTPMSVAAIAPRTATRARRLWVPPSPISDVSLPFPEHDATPLRFPLARQPRSA